MTSWVQGLRLRERLVDILVDMFGERLGEIFGERFGERLGVRFDDSLGWVSRLVKCWIRGQVSLGEGLLERQADWKYVSRINQERA